MLQRGQEGGSNSLKFHRFKKSLFLVGWLARVGFGKVLSLLTMYTVFGNFTGTTVSATLVWHGGK